VQSGAERAVSNDVSVVDLATQKVIKKINVGASPWCVLALAP
jgi:YVTN family beta-propeller protein